MYYIIPTTRYVVASCMQEMQYKLSERFDILDPDALATFATLPHSSTCPCMPLSSKEQVYLAWVDDLDESIVEPASIYLARSDMRDPYCHLRGHPSYPNPSKTCPIELCWRLCTARIGNVKWVGGCPVNSKFIFA